MTTEQIQLLDQLPVKVLSNIVADYASDDAWMTASTFWVATHQILRTCDPLELYDWCVAKIRWKLVERLRQRGCSV